MYHVNRSRAFAELSTKLKALGLARPVSTEVGMKHVRAKRPQEQSATSPCLVRFLGGCNFCDDVISR